MIKKLNYTRFVTIFVTLYVLVIADELSMRTDLEYYSVRIENWYAMFIIPGLYYLLSVAKVARRVNQICEGIGKASKNGVVEGIGSNITLGIYGYFWLGRQLDRLKEKAERLHAGQVQYHAKYWYLSYMITNMISTIFLLIVWSTFGEYVTFENIWFYMNIYHVFTIIILALTSVYSYCFAKEINNLTDAYNDSLRIPHIIDNGEDVDVSMEDVHESVTIQEDVIRKYVLVCESGFYQGASFPVDCNAYILIGRDGQYANIVITQSQVSRQHCRIRYNMEKQLFEVIDDSSVGTYVNGEKLSRGNVYYCQKGSYVQLGTSNNVFQLQEERWLWK